MEEYYGINDFMSSINSDRKFLEDIVFNKIKKHKMGELKKDINKYELDPN